MRVQLRSNDLFYKRHLAKVAAMYSHNIYNTHYKNTQQNLSELRCILVCIFGLLNEWNNTSKKLSLGMKLKG